MNQFCPHDQRFDQNCASCESDKRQYDLKIKRAGAREMQPIFWHRKKKEMFKAISISFYYGLEHVGYYPDIVMEPDNYEEAWLDDVDLRWPTGLKDMNGTEIYEGDILSVNLIEWREVFKCYYDQANVRFSLIDSNNDKWGFSHANDFVVIGNIYENSELLTLPQAPDSTASPNHCGSRIGYFR